MQSKLVLPSGFSFSLFCLTIKIKGASKLTKTPNAKLLKETYITYKAQFTQKFYYLLYDDGLFSIIVSCLSSDVHQKVKTTVPVHGEIQGSTRLILVMITSRAAQIRVRQPGYKRYFLITYANR